MLVDNISNTLFALVTTLIILLLSMNLDANDVDKVCPVYVLKQ